MNRDRKARQQAGAAADDYEHQPGPGEVWGYRDEQPAASGAPAGDSWV